MALFTRYDRMQADQGEFRNVMVKAHLGAPAALIMAGFTFLSLLPLMHIIEQMTAYTVHFKFFFINIVLLMASSAFNFYMLPIKFELRITVVIEFDLIPGLLFVAVLAFYPKTALMLVVMLMARGTV
jgi:hypothetical protein